MPVADTSWLRSLPGVLPEEPLSRHSQFGVGGPAEWFLKVADVPMLQQVLRRAAEAALPVTVLGAGSNALIVDEGVRGLVIRFEERGLGVAPARDAVTIGGGSMLPRVALDCAKRGLAGLEFGIGVPGTCGASVYGNAGAFGSEMRDVLIECTAVTPAGDVATFSNAECGFSYRFSRFKTELAGHVVVSARLRAHADDAGAVRQRTDAVQAQRKATQPYGVRSLGSVFKNPPDDKAGRLLEAAGLKGRRHGGAQISAKHANFIVNVQQATAADVLTLVRIGHDTVLQRFGIDLEPEIVILGGAGAEVTAAV